MKFLPGIEGAPDIPSEIIKFQEKGRLVFFVGAGISCYLGFPTFKKLVKIVHQECLGSRIDAKELRETSYEQILEKIEKSVYNVQTAHNRFRDCIFEILGKEEEQKFETHKAILSLSKDKDNNCRIVTTNQDKSFLYSARSSDININVAPALPIPKISSWNSIVHLHGIADRCLCPRGKNLIFTSGDFGRAYLTEGWATRFVVELFKNFHVLFVGYSIRDPIMRYIVDAIAAEKINEEGAYKQSYILTCDAENMKEWWLEKGVIPIFYKKENDHAYLHQTLKKWGKHVSQGIRAEEAIIKNALHFKPMQEMDNSNSDEVMNITEILKKSSDYSLAKSFSTLLQKNTSFPNEEKTTWFEAWLNWLDKNGLLNCGKNGFIVEPICSNPSSQCPDLASWHLWKWIAEHYDQIELVEWVIQKNGFLHEELKRKIHYKIKCDTGKLLIPSWVIEFWEIILTDKFLIKNDFSESEILRINGTLISIFHLEHLLCPQYKFSMYPYRKSKEFKENTPYRAEVTIRLSSYLYMEEREKIILHTRENNNFIWYVVSALVNAMRLMEFIKEADTCRDWSSVALPTLSGQDRESFYFEGHGWAILVDLCWRLWEDAFDSNNFLAVAILEGWKSIKYPVFRRLVFHAYSRKDFETPAVILDSILVNGGFWLYVPDVQYELCELLDKILHKLSREETDRLIGTLLTAPSEENLKKSFTEKYIAYIMSKLLQKIKYYGIALSETAKQKLNSIFLEYPAYEFNEKSDNRPNFDIFSLKNSPDSNFIVDFFCSREEEIIDKVVLQNTDRDGIKYLEYFRQGAQKHPQKVVAVLQFLCSKHLWYDEMWGIALKSLANSDFPNWSLVSKLLLDAPISLFQNQTLAVAWWIKSASKTMFSAEEIYFWKLADKIFEANSSKKMTKPFEKNKEYIAWALNEPLGILVQAFISNIFSKLHLKKGDGIKEQQHRRFLDDACSFLSAKAMLVQYLTQLHKIDISWANNNLIPSFQWKRPEALIVWQNYLSSGQIYFELAAQLKDEILDGLRKAEELGKYYENLCQVFNLICLEYPTIYSQKEKRAAFRNIGVEGLNVVIKYLWQIFPSSQDKDGKLVTRYWKNLEKNIFKFWPLQKEFYCEKISTNLAELCIRSGENFPHAINHFLHWLVPLENPYYILYLLNNNVAEAKNFPQELLKMLKILLPKRSLCKSEGKELKNILEDIEKSDATIVNDSIYKELLEFVKKTLL